MTLTFTGGVWRVDTDITNRLEELKNAAGVRSGWRYATFQYDKGLATASFHAGDAQSVAIRYLTDGTTRLVKNGRRQETRYATTIQNGAALVTAIDGPSCTGVAGESSFQCDPATNKLLSQTVNGLTTQYGGYDSHGNSGFMIEAAGTALARRTEYTYDPRFWD
jgi:hypothetical protein